MTTYTIAITDLQGNTTRTETFTAISVEELLELQKRKREEELRKVPKDFDPYKVLMDIALTMEM